MEQVPVVPVLSRAFGEKSLSYFGGQRCSTAHLASDRGDETMKKPTTKDLFKRIDQGVKAGVASALEEHRKAGNSVFIWRRGRIVRVSASQIKTGKANGRK